MATSTTTSAVIELTWFIAYLFTEATEELATERGRLAAELNPKYADADKTSVSGIAANEAEGNDDSASS